MPCYATTTIRLDLGKVDPAILDRAMRRAGYAARGSMYERGSVTVYRAADGGLRVTMPSRRDENATTIEHEIRRAVSREVIHEAARRFRWNIRESRGTIELSKTSIGSRF